MTDEQHEKQAETHHSRWVGWIWAVPLAVLGIVGWLAIRELSNSGPEVTVVFSTAGGVKEGDTKVQYKEMEVGHVEKVELQDDLQHVKITLQLNASLDGKLGPKTRFWIAGENARLTNLSSLKAAVLGPYIGVEPVPGPDTDHFQGLEKPPIVPAEKAGSNYTLHTDDIGSISRGSQINYLGMAIGEVRAARLAKDQHSINISIFVRAPYNALVRTDSRFWDASAVRLSMKGGSPSLQLASIPALVSGAIALQSYDPSAPIAPPGTDFYLYPSKDAAKYSPGLRAQTYIVEFEGTGSSLEPGAAVKLSGTQVGTVRDVSLVYDPGQGELRTRARIAIEPSKIKLADAGDWEGDVQAKMNDMVGRLVAKGLRAHLTKSPPVIGGQVVSLDFVPNAKSARLQPENGGLAIPTAPASDTDHLMASASDIAAKVDNIASKIDAMPLSQIAQEVHTTTQHVAAIMQSGEVDQSVHRLNSSLGNIEAITGEARGKVGPILTQIQQATSDARETLAAARAILTANGSITGRPGASSVPETLYQLSRAARALRQLSDYLDRHPEALLQGKVARQ